MTDAETPCAQTRALLAVMQDDGEQALSLIGQIPAGERVVFYHDLVKLTEIVGGAISDETAVPVRAGRHRKR